MFEGQVMTGSAPGRTATVNEQEACGPDGPTAVQVTVLVRTAGRDANDCRIREAGAGKRRQRVNNHRAGAASVGGDVRRAGDFAARLRLGKIEDHPIRRPQVAGDDNLAGIRRKVRPERRVAINTRGLELEGREEAGGGIQRHVVPANIAAQRVIVPSHETEVGREWRCDHRVGASEHLDLI
jgi:hypothetical protein